jgi:transcriptional regulator with XRE-family HTH domain
MDSIGDRIKHIRKINGLTQQKFGERVKVTKAHVSKIELSDDKPSDMLIKLICIEFGINEEWLKNGTGSMNPRPFTENENAAQDIEESLLRLNSELQNGLEDSYNFFGTMLDDSLKSLNALLKNEPHANRAIDRKSVV